VHERAIAAKVKFGATSTLEVRERLARYTGNMIPLVMSRTQREKVQCFFCSRCYKAILPTWRGPSMVSTADLKFFAPSAREDCSRTSGSGDEYDRSGALSRFRKPDY
jgi:hypothetical protein